MFVLDNLDRFRKATTHMEEKNDTQKTDEEKEEQNQIRCPLGCQTLLNCDKMKVHLDLETNDLDFLLINKLVCAKFEISCRKCKIDLIACEYMGHDCF